VHEAAGAVFAMCDSTIPGRPEGFLAYETIERRERVLADEVGGARAFVCFHHPPVELGSPQIDIIRQQSEDRLTAVIGRHPQLVALLCGHAHPVAATTCAGLPLLVTPGAASTAHFPFEPHGDRSWAACTTTCRRRSRSTSSTTTTA
jgi:Icc-related predicted phosphoesterase